MIKIVRREDRGSPRVWVYIYSLWCECVYTFVYFCVCVYCVCLPGKPLTRNTGCCYACSDVVTCSSWCFCVCLSLSLIVSVNGVLFQKKGEKDRIYIRQYCFVSLFLFCFILIFVLFFYFLILALIFYFYILKFIFILFLFIIFCIVSCPHSSLVGAANKH